MQAQILEEINLRNFEIKTVSKYRVTIQNSVPEDYYGDYNRVIEEEYKGIKNIKLSKL